MYKMAYTVPKWLLHVPKGEYDIQQLVDMTGESSHGIYMRLENLGVKKTLKKIIRKDEKSVWKNIYAWEGAEFYLTEALRRSINDIKQQQEGIKK